MAKSSFFALKRDIVSMRDSIDENQANEVTRLLKTALGLLCMDEAVSRGTLTSAINGRVQSRDFTKVCEELDRLDGVIAVRVPNRSGPSFQAYVFQPTAPLMAAERTRLYERLQQASERDRDNVLLLNRWDCELVFLNLSLALCPLVCFSLVGRQRSVQEAAQSRVPVREDEQQARPIDD